VSQQLLRVARRQTRVAQPKQHDSQVGSGRIWLCAAAWIIRSMMSSWLCVSNCSV
jgi:hypothetical protein